LAHHPLTTGADAAWVTGERGWLLLRALLAGLVAIPLAACGPVGPPGGGPGATSAPAIRSWPLVNYENDGYATHTCSGTGALSYAVLSPAHPGHYPVVFGITGTAFSGSAGCLAGTRSPQFLSMQPLLSDWVRAGYVAVDIEYHGYANGLLGDTTYPGPGHWGQVADGTTQLDIKPAIEHFLAHHPERYGADPALGLVVFGTSSGAHDAYMLAVTGVPGVRLSAVVGWSGLPDASLAGGYARYVFDRYMGTTAGSDIEAFGDPQHRVQPQMPLEYVANARWEFIDWRGSEAFASACQRLRVTTWLRVPASSAHAGAYAYYHFSGQPPELAYPTPPPGTTVIQDSITFASRAGHAVGPAVG